MRTMTFGQSLGAALAGAAIGWVAVLLLCAVLGVAAMFLAWPLYAIALFLLGLVAALLAATASRLMPRLGWRATAACAAILTFGIFTALMLRIVLANVASGRW